MVHATPQTKRLTRDLWPSRYPPLQEQPLQTHRSSFLIRPASRVARQRGNTSQLCAEFGQQKGSNARPVLGDWLLWCILTDQLCSVNRPRVRPLPSAPTLSPLRNRPSDMPKQRRKHDFGNSGSIPKRDSHDRKGTSPKQRKQLAHNAPVRRASSKFRE
jgi:hypothetical protein